MYKNEESVQIKMNESLKFLKKKRFKEKDNMFFQQLDIMSLVIMLHD